jgi:GNAT superfamily N-acetyltransferase
MAADMLIDNLPDDLGEPWPGAFEFDSQKIQYPALGEPGISYFSGETFLGVVDCLLYRDTTGEVRGILNHYSFNAPWDFPIQALLSGEAFMEHTGNINIFIDPDFKLAGIATDLLDAAAVRWDIDLAQQRYTEDGQKFIRAYITRKRREMAHTRYLQVIDGEDLPYGGSP